MFIRIVYSCIAVFIAGNVAYGQDSKPVELHLWPLSASESAGPRLLPTDPELKDGNAAVVLLRMIWEQQPYMQSVLPTFPELLKLPYDDLRIVNDFHFGHFYATMKRAAYMRDAEWNYPLNEEPLGTILLPDIQGLRDLAGRGMSLWIGQQIAKNNLNEAREGILIQLACSRHVARTPLTINRLVAESFAGMATDKIELLIQQKESANLYWALAMLPDSLGDRQAALQWEATLIEGSLPALAAGEPGLGAPAWKQAAAEFSELLLMQMQKPMTPTEGAALQQRLIALARAELPLKTRFGTEDLASMSDEELVMRWTLVTTREIHTEIERAYSLAPPLALKRLFKLESDIAAIMQKTEAPTAPFPEHPARMYMAFHKFDRKVKLLQTVEAIRDYAAKNDGTLPTNLEALELPAPNDPLTEQPFFYGVADDQATLRAERLPGLDASLQPNLEYSITIRNAK